MKRPFYKCWWTYPLLLFMIGLIFAGCLLTGILINAKRLNDPQSADVIIVLGAQIGHDGLPKPVLERRLNMALSLYNADYAPAIIVTGAQGSDEPMTEALSMQRYLVKNGIDSSVIFCEDMSYSTHENLAYAKIIMEEKGYETALIVTSDYHLWRALSIAEDLGIQASAAGALGAIAWYQTIRNHVRETLSWGKYVLGL